MLGWTQCHNADIRVGTGACQRPSSTDETYYAIIFILFLMVQSGFIAFGFWLVDYLFNSNIGITPSYTVH